MIAFKSQFILIAGFLPLDVIYIVRKIAVWMSAINNETIYVSKEKFRKRGPYVENPYADVDEEEEEFTDRTDYR